MKNINDARICTYGTGAYARGTVGSKFGEDTGTIIYKVTEND